MLTLSQYCDLLVAIWLLCWAALSIGRIVGGRQQPADYLILTHFTFCGVPAILDLVLGTPLYLLFTSFGSLRNEPLVDCVYALYVCSCPPIWCKWGRVPETCKRRLIKTDSTRGREIFQLALYLVASAPLILFLLAPDKHFYSSYAAVIEDSMSDAMVTFQGYMTAATILAVLAVAGIWFSCRQLSLNVVGCLPLLLSAAWLNGKRHIVLLAAVLLLLSLVERGALLGRKLVGVGVLTALSFASFSYLYQSGVRSKDKLASAAQYEDFRIDFGRDHGIKYAIYCELHPEVHSILEYRGQSILFNLMFFLPRELWPEKPWPYAVYATSADLGISPESLGWAITTSWLEEAIANFGWAGLLVGPFSLAYLCRFGQQTNSGACRIFTAVVVCLFLAVQLSAFQVLAVAWVFTVLLSRNHNSRKSRIRLRMPTTLPIMVQRTCTC